MGEVKYEWLFPTESVIILNKYAKQIWSESIPTGYGEYNDQNHLSYCYTIDFSIHKLDDFLDS